MAQQLSPIHFEDIPLEEARTMGRGPRMAKAAVAQLGPIRALGRGG